MVVCNLFPLWLPSHPHVDTKAKSVDRYNVWTHHNLFPLWLPSHPHVVRPKQIRRVVCMNTPHSPYNCLRIRTLIQIAKGVIGIVMCEHIIIYSPYNCIRIRTTLNLKHKTLVTFYPKATLNPHCKISIINSGNIRIASTLPPLTACASAQH